MTDAGALVALSAFGLAGLGLATAAVLRGWNGWMELRRLQISAGSGTGSASGGRAEIARLRERVKRLEAIASGAEG